MPGVTEFVDLNLLSSDSVSLAFSETAHLLPPLKVSPRPSPVVNGSNKQVGQSSPVSSQ